MKAVKQVTELNLWSLNRLFPKVLEGVTSAPNKIDRPSLSHVRRCMQAELVVPFGSVLDLTPAGVRALKVFNAAQEKFATEKEALVHADSLIEAGATVKVMRDGAADWCAKRWCAYLVSVASGCTGY